MNGNLIWMAAVQDDQYLVEALENIDKKFRSGNSVKPESVRIKTEDWERVRDVLHNYVLNIAPLTDSELF